MTLLEFEAWVSDNYPALVGAAERVTRFDARAKDCLHEAIEAVSDGRVSLHDGPPSVGWLMRVVHFKQLERYERDVNYTNLLKRFMGEVEAAGLEEALADPAHTKNLRKNRRYKAKMRGGDPQSPSGVGVTSLLQGQVGDTRWVYQQRRDAQAYDGQALRSLAESIRGRSCRALRGSGRSYVEWGLEVAMDPRVLAAWRNGEVKGFFEGGWTQISQSTGYQFHGKKWIGQDSPGTFDQCGGCTEHAISGRHDKACALVKGAAA